MPNVKYPENFRDDIRETVKNHEVISDGWYDAWKDCGCPITELVIRKGWATREICKTELTGASYYFDLLRDKYDNGWNSAALFIDEWDKTFPVFKNLTPIEIANLIFRRDDENSKPRS